MIGIGISDRQTRFLACDLLKSIRRLRRRSHQRQCHFTEETKLLVGKEATAETHLTRNWPIRLPLGMRAAPLAAVLVALFWLPIAASAQEISPDPIQVSGNSIYRWQIGKADASLLEGDCVLAACRQSGHRRLDPVGDRWSDRTRTFAGRDLGDEIGRGAKRRSPRACTFLTLTDPKSSLHVVPRHRRLRRRAGSVSSPRTSRSATTDPRVCRGDCRILPEFGVQQVQFSEPLIAPPESGPPPITLSDGATTGGFQFLTGGGSRSVEILSRGASMPPQIETINRPELGETVILARGGVTVLIRDVTAQLPNGEFMELGTISLVGRSRRRLVAAGDESVQWHR